LGGFCLLVRKPTLSRVSFPRGTDREGGETHLFQARGEEENPEEKEGWTRKGGKVDMAK